MEGKVLKNIQSKVPVLVIREVINLNYKACVATIRQNNTQQYGNNTAEMHSDNNTATIRQKCIVTR